MKRPLVLIAALAIVTVACARNGDPTPTATPGPQITAEDVESAVLTIDDLGEGWESDEDATPSTVQIGGRVGPANIRDAEVSATNGFVQEAGTGYVSNSIFLLESVEIAQAVMLAHEEADGIESWTQERRDGGGAQYERTGRIDDLPSLGDERYSATLDATVRDAEGEETERAIEYIVFRVDRVLAFVVAQDEPAGGYAGRQERKLARLTS